MSRENSSLGSGRSLRYCPLSQEDREIRTIILLPSTDPHLPIRCTTSKVSLNGLPKYHALSYAWGDPSITAPIFLDDVEVQVTTNLEAALRQIRISCNGAKMQLWIDAICINQNDPVERSQQVQLMGEIYTAATSALVWLGAEHDNSTLALEKIQKLVQDHINGGLEYDRTLSAINNLKGTAAFNAMISLFQRPWWFRLWTVQEVVFAKEVNVLCGSKFVSWGIFTDWCHIVNAVNDPSTWTQGRYGFLELFYAPGVSQSFAKTFLRMMYKKSNSTNQTLMKILSNCSRMQCSDPRDRIYALQGLATDGADFGLPDYTLSVSELYVKVAAIKIEKDQDLGILHYTIPQSLPAIDRGALPSWVPTWSVSKGSPRPLHAELYCAARNRKAIALFNQPSLILFTQGIMWDGVIAVDGEAQRDRPSWPDLIYQGRERTYPTGIPQLQAYFRTILLDKDTNLENRICASNDSFFDLAAAFSVYLFKFSYDASSELYKWREHYRGLCDSDPFEFDIFLGDEDCKSLLKWPENLTIADIVHAATRKGSSFISTIVERMRDRSFFVTERGYMGMGSRAIDKDDFVCVFPGCNVPFILRKIDGYYVLKGECFVFGLMDGEAISALDDGAAELEELEIH